MGNVWLIGTKDIWFSHLQELDRSTDFPAASRAQSLLTPGVSRFLRASPGRCRGGISHGKGTTRAAPIWDTPNTPTPLRCRQDFTQLRCQFTPSKWTTAMMLHLFSTTYGCLLDLSSASHISLEGHMQEASSRPRTHKIKQQ